MINEQVNGNRSLGLHVKQINRVLFLVKDEHNIRSQHMYNWTVELDWPVKNLCLDAPFNWFSNFTF